MNIINASKQLSPVEVRESMETDGNIGGIFQISILVGELTDDTESLAKMNLCILIDYKGKHIRTRVIKGCGKHPVWNEMFKFNIDSMVHDAIKI